MDRVFKYMLDGEEWRVKQKDLPAFKAKGYLGRAEPKRAFEVNGEAVYVRKQDIDRFRARNAQAPELVELDDGTDAPRYVRRAERESFIAGLSGDEQVNVARQILPTSKYAKSRSEKLTDNMAGSDAMDAALVKGAAEGVVKGVRDLGVTAAKAVISVPQMATGAVDIMTAQPQMIASKILTGKARTGYVGKAQKELAGVDYKGTKEALDTLGSQEQQAAQRAVDDASGIAGTAKAYAKNPTVAVHQTLESIPSMAAGATIAPGLVAGRVAPALAGAIGEGIVTAAQMQEGMREEEPSGLTRPLQTAAAIGAGAVTAGIGYGTGKVAGRLGLVDPETLAAEGVAKAAVEKPLAAVPRVVLGGVQEGLEEGVQSVSEQMFQNAAMGRPLMEGTAKAGVGGAVVGSATGSGANIVPAGKPASTATPTEEAATPTEEPPPVPPTAAPEAGPPPVPPKMPTGEPASPTTPTGEAQDYRDIVNGVVRRIRPAIALPLPNVDVDVDAEAEAAPPASEGAQLSMPESRAARRRARSIFEDRKRKWNKLVNGVNNETITLEEFANLIVELVNSIEDVGLTPERFSALPEAMQKRVVDEVEQELKSNFVAIASPATLSANAPAQADDLSEVEQEAVKAVPDNVKPSRALKKVVENLEELNEENVNGYSNPALRKAATKLKEQADSARRSRDYDTANKLDAKRRMIYQAIDRKGRRSEKQQEAWDAIKREQIRGTVRDFLNTKDEGSYRILEYLVNNGPYFIKPAAAGEVFKNGIPNKTSGVGFDMLDMLSRDEKAMLFRPRPDGEVGGLDAAGEFGAILYGRGSNKWTDTTGPQEFLQDFRNELDELYRWQAIEDEAIRKIEEEPDPARRERLKQARQIEKEAGAREAQAFMDQMDEQDAEQSEWDKFTEADQQARFDAMAREDRLASVVDAVSGLANLPSEVGDVVTLDGVEFTVACVDEDGTMMLAGEDEGGEIVVEYGNEKVEARYESVREQGQGADAGQAGNAGQAEAGARPGPGGQEGFGLDGGSAEEIAAEQRRAKQRAEMERLQNRELDGRGAEGMDQPGLNGIDSDVPLFNQPLERFNVAEGPVEMFAPDRSGQGGDGATGARMRDAEQGARGGKLDGKPRLGMMEADLLEFATALLVGKLPRVVKALRGLAGTASGAFRISEEGKISIDIRADQALVVSNEERLEILRKAQQITELEMGADAAGTDEVAFATRRQQLIKQMLNDAFSRNVVRDRPALMRVLAHEAAHALDFMPDGTLKRGNIFGHIAALLDYTKKTMGMDPRSPGPLTEDEKKEMMKRARREVGQGKERTIIEEIVREVPEYKILGIKPEDVTSLLGTDAGKATPELYAWFAAQDTQTKKEILKAAIKGAVDPRLDQFGKKVQTGTRTERETKTTTFKPTEQDVRKRFRELLKEEVAARRLAELAVVKKELEDLIAWYNDSETMPEYYQAPAEMFAEAFSAWLNYPGEVKMRAPIFNGMMEEWIAARPEALKEYQAIQKKLAEPQKSASDRWNAFEKEMQAVTLRTVAAADKAGRWTRGERRDQLSAFWLRRMNPVYARVWKLADKMQAGNTVLALAKMRLSGAAQEIMTGLWGTRVIDPLRRAGVDMERFNGYLFATRVAKEGVETMVNDARDRGRANLANPIGANAASAEARLAELRQSMGEEKYAAMEKAAEEMWKIRQEELFPVLKETGVSSPEQYEMIAENWAYAKFATDQTGEMTELQKMMSGSFGPGSGIHAQHGTFQQIGGPAENTLMADISMWQWALAQDAKYKALAAIAKVDPTMIEPADFSVVNGRRVYRDVDTPRVKTIYYTRGGKLYAFNVPTSIAQALGRTTEGTGEVVNKAAAWIIQKQAQVLTTHNIGFATRNPGRDFADGSKLLPSPYWFNLPWVGNPLLAKEVLANFKTSVLREFMILDDQTLKGLRRGMLVPNVGSYAADAVYEKDGFAKAFRKAGITTPQQALSASKKAAELVWDMWAKLTGVLHTSETAMKLGSMDYLDKYYPDMPEWEKQWKVEKLGGTPAVLEHSNFGSMPAFRIFVMYYNINKEALLNHIEAFKERPGEYAFKTAVGAIPQIIQYGAIYGLFSGLFRFLADAIGGDDDDSEEDKAKAAQLNTVADDWADWEEMQKSIPFRDRMLYSSLAFEWDDKKNGKAAYFRFMDSPIAGAQRALMFGGIDAAAGRISWKQMFSIGVGDQLPNTSPVMATIFAVATGYDPSFGFREFVDREAPAKVKLQEFAKLAWNNMTGGGLGLYRMRQDPRLGDPEPGQIEAWLQKPWIPQITRSFVRVSNSGIKDEMRVEDMMMKREDWNERTAMDELVQAWGEGREAAQGAREAALAIEPGRRDRLLAERVGKMGSKELGIWQRRAMELPEDQPALKEKAMRRSDLLNE